MYGMEMPPHLKDPFIFTENSTIEKSKNLANLISQKLNIVEIKMSNNQWNNINYENISNKSLVSFV